jgi:hypothetical protein
MSNYVRNGELSFKRISKFGMEIARAEQHGQGEVFIELDDAAIERLYNHMMSMRSREAVEPAKGNCSP